MEKKKKDIVDEIARLEQLSERWNEKYLDKRRAFEISSELSSFIHTLKKKLS